MDKIKSTQLKKEIKRSIPDREVYFSFGIILFLLIILSWVFLQHDNYHPEDRDISNQLLISSAEPINLYKPPLKNWQEKEEGEAAEKGQSSGIFPAALLNGGWKIAAPIRYFNPKNLYVKINGEAIRFLNEGFKALHYLVLKSVSGNDEIAVELYDQGEDKGSIAVFSEYLSGNKRLIRRGNSVFITTSAGAIGRKGPFFFRISGNRTSEIIRTKSIQLASALSALPGRKKSEAPGLEILKNVMKLDSSLIEYRGKNVFQFGYAEDFWFGRLNKEDQARIFVHKSGNSSAADELFKKLVADQGMDYRLIKQESGIALMQHNFLKTYFAIGKKGSYVYGIEKKKEQEGIADIMSRLSGNLK